MYAAETLLTSLPMSRCKGWSRWETWGFWNVLESLPVDQKTFPRQFGQAYLADGCFAGTDTFTLALDAKAQDLDELFRYEALKMRTAKCKITEILGKRFFSA